MDDLLFNIIAWVSVVGFALGIISGFWPVLLISLGIAVLLLTLGKKLRQ